MKFINIDDQTLFCFRDYATCWSFNIDVPNTLILDIKYTCTSYEDDTETIYLHCGKYIESEYFGFHDIYTYSSLHKSEKYIYLSSLRKKRTK